MYLGHAFSELGGTGLESVLDELRDFLVANPEEVLVVINQDYLTPADFVAAVNDADLDDFAYRGPVKGGLLTLRQMIDRNQRVVPPGREPRRRRALVPPTKPSPKRRPTRSPRSRS